MAAILVCFAPEILKLLGSGKTVLPREWLSLLAVLTFLEMQFSAWGSLIATGNRMPFLRSTVLTHVSGVVISVLLVSFSPLAAGSFILGPLLSGCAFYFWYWPREGARTLGTTWSKFMFSRP